MIRRMRFLLFLICGLCGPFSTLQVTNGNEAFASPTMPNAGEAFFMFQRPMYPKDCKEVMDQCPIKNSSGAFAIKPEGYPYPFEVYCASDVGSSGWTLLMRRFDGSINFTRNWHEYKNGFGFLGTEYWIGYDKLSSITNQKKYQLLIDMTFSNGSKRFLTFSDFSVGDELSNYTLTALGDYEGDADFSTCDTGYLIDGSTCRRPRDCAEVPSVEGYHGSGLYYILPSNWQEFQVYCNMSEGRWTVFQRRKPGTGRNFFLTWNSYKVGFGDLEEDFWLGNDNIHHLTSQANYELRIDIIDNGNRFYKAIYSEFRIGNNATKYRITTLGTYSGNAGYDAMRAHVNQPFTTRDHDNDDWDGSDCNYQYFDDSCENHGNANPHNCAFLHEGAWWYKSRGSFTRGGCDTSSSYSDCNNQQCHQKSCCADSQCNSCGTLSYSCAFSNLNGPERGPKGKNIIWHGLAGNDCLIKFTEMKIRPI